jgi:uncharacterized protein
MYISRQAHSSFQHLFSKFPILAVTGPRQSGKSTLVQRAFPEKPYVSLEAPDIREFALDDPRGFLAKYPDGAILDEVQRCPDLFSYLQEIVDKDGRMSLFVLTGSQQFGLGSGITQSLAGRVAMTVLLPFETQEKRDSSLINSGLDEELLLGGYPPIHDRGLVPGEWFPSYIETYLERDVRQMLKVKDLRTFQRFLKLCAGRVGQLLNFSALSAECGVSYNTIKEWISVLEASYLIYLLPPYFRNLKKRLIKTPKLYFYDTGLAAWLMGIGDVTTLSVHPMRGSLFECWAINELRKREYHKACRPEFYFYRDRTGNEVDLVFEEGAGLHMLEIKSGSTHSRDQRKGLNYLATLIGENSATRTLLYGGDENQQVGNIDVISWKSWPGAKFGANH